MLASFVQLASVIVRNRKGCGGTNGENGKENQKNRFLRKEKLRLQISAEDIKKQHSKTKRMTSINMSLYIQPESSKNA